MKYGIREICEIVFKAKSKLNLGGVEFTEGQPVLYMDTATTSSLEQATTTVYAQGGRGNSRLVAWDGEKTLTLNVTDALISPISLKMLSGANLLRPGKKAGEDVTAKAAHAHVAETVMCSAESGLEVTDTPATLGKIFVSKLDKSGSIEKTASATASGKTITLASGAEFTLESGKAYFVDYYVDKAEAFTEMQIAPDVISQNFYVEAETLFRDEDGNDYPAIITIPNAKIQSNFTFTMAASGDPSTFDFVMDCLPGYTYFNSAKKVLCAIQILDDPNAAKADEVSVFEGTYTLKEDESGE